MKIIFPTDFSPTAENAFVYALKLAEKLNAGITVMHVYQELHLHTWVENSLDIGQLNDRVTLDEFEYFKDQIEQLKRVATEMRLDHVDVNFALRESDYVVEAILDEAKEDAADIIVMGTQGARGFKELFFGSVASKVMEASACPVLIIPEAAHYKGIEKIGLTLEYKPGELELIEASVAVARRLGAQLHCLHVDVFDPEPVQVKVLEYKKAFGHESDIRFHVYNEMDVERGILEFMKFNQIDAVIMSVHHQSLLKELFSYSIAKRVAYHTDIPVIALHIQA